MRLCNLRVGISKAAGSSLHILGNPKAWLGTAYHEILEKLQDADPREETLGSAIDRLWTQAIQRQHDRISLHPLDRRFGRPETWPGYNVAKACVALRARELISDTTAPDVRIESTRSLEMVREREFTAFDGRLTGRPDLIRSKEVIDYKSGVITEFDETTQTEIVKAAYVRQLRIYGFLVKETLGWWPHRGILLPLAGPAVDVVLKPTECTQDATEAISLLKVYNARLRSGGSADALASPSPSVCKWCPFKIICPAFWRTASSAWSGQLDGAAVEGVLDEPPRPIHAGAAVTISVQVEKGSEESRTKQIAPLDPTLHANLHSLTSGDRIRIVSLRVRPDGVLVPTQRTILARVNDLPEIAVSAGESS
jgi:hypothetical protein